MMAEKRREQRKAKREREKERKKEEEAEREAEAEKQRFLQLSDREKVEFKCFFLVLVQTVVREDPHNYRMLS